VGFRIAGLFWQKNGLNELADREMFETITRRINGGLNGYPDRQKYFAQSKQILGVGTSRDLPGPDDDSDLPPPEFTRGREVIDAEPPRRRPRRKAKRASKKSTTKKAAPKTGRSKAKSPRQRKSSSAKKK
jgi:hypothetical protein